MIFGLFKTKSQRLLELTEESLRETDIFVGIIKEKIGEGIISWMKRCENEDINSLKDIGKEAMEERQSEITAMGENNPNWVRACIVESYISAKILGFFVRTAWTTLRKRSKNMIFVKKSYSLSIKIPKFSRLRRGHSQQLFNPLMTYKQLF